MDFYQLIFRRYYDYDAGREPVISLNASQRERITLVLEKIREGDYILEDLPCICGEEDASILVARKDRYGFPVETRLCRKCGILRTTPKFAPESLSRFYEEDFRQIYDPACSPSSGNLDQVFATEGSRGKFILDAIRPRVGEGRHLTVFDVGCGLGGSLVPFVKEGWTAYGCDLDGKHLQYGRTRGLTLEHGPLQTLTEKYGHADLIILSHVLEHIECPGAFLRDLHDALKDGGLLFLELPGIFHIHRTYGDIMAFLQNAHMYHYTLHTLSDLTGRNGFRLVAGTEDIHALFQKDAGRIRDSPGETAGYYYIKILIYLMGIAVSYRVIHMKGIHTIYRKISRYLPVFSVETDQAG